MKTYNKIRYYILKQRATDKKRLSSLKATPEEDDLYQKVNSVWEKCAPKPISSVSIWEKTMAKTQLKSKQRKRTVILAASLVAASFLALLFIGHHFFLKEQSLSEPDFLLAVQDDSVEYKDITLVLPDKKITVDEGVDITYSKQGDIDIDPNAALGQSPTPKEDSIEEYDKIIIPKGKRARLILSDGTKLWLNSGSKAVYPKLFTKKHRTIYIDGEVFLDVVEDKDKPFVVKTAGFEIEVLGTRFNLSAYGSEATASLVLVEGKVMITDVNRAKTQVSPNELVTLKENIVERKEKVDVAEYICWIDGYLNLKGELLPKLIDRLSLYYGRTILFDPLLSNEKIYGKLDLKENLHILLNGLPLSIPFRVEEKGENIHISAGE